MCGAGFCFICCCPLISNCLGYKAHTRTHAQFYAKRISVRLYAKLNSFHFISFEKRIWNTVETQQKKKKKNGVVDMLSTINKYANEHRLVKQTCCICTLLPRFILIGKSPTECCSLDGFVNKPAIRKSFVPVRKCAHEMLQKYNESKEKKIVAFEWNELNLSWT